MSELKHTKSPWLIADDDPTFVYALGPHGTNLFWVPVQASGPEKIGREEAVANAHLIAAAPELLAALQDLIEDITHEDHRPKDWSVQAVVRQARAAIAKATGAA